MLNKSIQLLSLLFLFLSVLNTSKFSQSHHNYYKIYMHYYYINSSSYDYWKIKNTSKEAIPIIKNSSPFLVYSCEKISAPLHYDKNKINFSI